MPSRIETYHLAIERMVQTGRSVSDGEAAENRSSGWRFPSVLFLVGVGFFLIGFLLVFLGSAGPVSSGGCFFWPFPVIVVCGLGTGGGSFLVIGVFAAVLMSVMMVLGWWMRKPGAEGSPCGSV